MKFWQRRTAPTKLLLIALLLMLVCALAGQTAPEKLYVQMQVDHQPTGSNYIYFIQDRETGTRCYAITATGADGGRAISCVPEKGR